MVSFLDFPVLLGLPPVAELFAGVVAGDDELVPSPLFSFTLIVGFFAGSDGFATAAGDFFAGGVGAGEVSLPPERGEDEDGPLPDEPCSGPPGMVITSLQ